jgi:hypothetical protein
MVEEYGDYQPLERLLKLSKIGNSLFFSHLNYQKKKKKIGTEIESVCFNFVVLWRRNEDSLDLSPTRDFEEKKHQAKTRLL